MLMKSKGTAYLLWLVSGFGILGLHRFYLGKVGTGILWFFTWGLGGIGCIYDLFTLSSQVDMVNMRLNFRSGGNNLHNQIHVNVNVPGYPMHGAYPAHGAQPLSYPMHQNLNPPMVEGASIYPNYAPSESLNKAAS